MRTIAALLNQLTADPSCAIFKSNAYPLLPDGLILPNDLADFYQLCGGIQLYTDQPYSFELVKPDDFIRANPVIAETEGNEDISYNWFIIGKQGGDQYITIDLDPLRLGRCYDSFWDIHAVAGSCPIIAYSFLELFNRLVDIKGQGLFWQSSTFTTLGDAYELI